jgi:hypothetical protein
MPNPPPPPLPRQWLHAPPRRSMAIPSSSMKYGSRSSLLIVGLLPWSPSLPPSLPLARSVQSSQPRFTLLLNLVSVFWFHLVRLSFVYIWTMLKLHSTLALVVMELVSTPPICLIECSNSRWSLRQLVSSFTIVDPLIAHRLHVIFIYGAPVVLIGCMTSPLGSPSNLKDGSLSLAGIRLSPVWTLFRSPLPAPSLTWPDSQLPIHVVWITCNFPPKLVFKSRWNDATGLTSNPTRFANPTTRYEAHYPKLAHPSKPAHLSPSLAHYTQSDTTQLHHLQMMFWPSPPMPKLQIPS